jgi:hypothetical protein
MNIRIALLRSLTWPQAVITTRRGTEYWFSREPKVNFTDPGIPAGRTEDDHHVTRAFYFGRSFLIITKPKRQSKRQEVVAANVAPLTT